MLKTDDYEILKASLIKAQRLFEKLGNVSDQFEELDFDESGMFLEDEETLNRHWLKLGSKVVDAISEALGGYKIELLKNSSLETRKLILNLVIDEVSSRIEIDYSKSDALSITQIS